MDIISFNEAATANGRIEKFIENPDSNSGIVTVPKVIGAGESVTIPAGRVAVLPNVQVDGTLNIEGEVFIPTGTTFGDLENQIDTKVAKVTSTDNAIVRFNGTTGEVQDSSVVIDDNGNVGINGAPTVYGKLNTKTTLPFDPINSNKPDTIGIWLASYNAVGLDQLGSGIVWSRFSSNSRPAAAIVPWQSSTDEEQLGLKIFTHSISTPTDELTEALSISHEGMLRLNGALNISKTSVTNGSLESNGNVFSGTYTPVITNVNNVASSTGYVSQYMRVGNVVTVSGYCLVSVTAINTNTRFTISLPIASNFTASTFGLSGTISSTHNTGYLGVQNGSGGIYLNSTTDEALVVMAPAEIGNQGYTFTFTYRIL